MQRLEVIAAVARVRRADRRGLINPGERRLAIALSKTNQQIMASFFFTGLLLPVGLLFLWVGDVSHTGAPRNPAALQADRWIAVAESLIQAHNTRAAIWNFTRAIEADSNAERAYRGRGEAFLEYGNPLEAIDDFSHVIMLNQHDTEAHLQRALAYASVGRNDLAASDYATVARLDLGGARQRILTAWQRAIFMHLNRNLRYPADRDEQDAEVTVRFSIDRNGHLLSKSVEKSSGDSEFDAAALAMLERSDPLLPSPPPVAIAEESWNFRMPVVFRAGSKGG